MFGWRTIEKLLAGRASSALLYGLIFLLAASPWLSQAAFGTPDSYDFGFTMGTHPGDARLVVAILTHVHRSLLGESPFFDLEIFHPLPGMLALSEHLLSAQIFFTPLFLATGEELLSANLAVWLSYPLSAWLMSRLLLQFSISPAAAFLGGFLFAVGPLRSQFNLHLLQYQNLFLPLLALALHRLRGRIDWQGLVGVSLALAAGVLSSFYLAVILAFFAVIWTLAEALRLKAGRLKFLFYAAIAATLAAVAVLPFMMPWFQNAGSLNTAASAQQYRAVAGIFWANWLLYWQPLIGWPVVGLGLISLLSFRSGSTDRIFLVIFGLLSTFLGLAVIPGIEVGGFQIPTPFELFDSLLGRAFRVPNRMIVISGFGLALLAALGFDQLLEGARRNRVVLALAVVLGLGAGYERIHRFSPAQVDIFDAKTRDREVYQKVAEATADRAGPLLQIPFRGNLWTLGPDAMVGALTHRMPLLTGHTGYLPPHTPHMLELIDRLPEAGALNSLGRMTGVRWLLISPEPYGRENSLKRLEPAEFNFAAEIPEGWIRSDQMISGWRLLELELPSSRDGQRPALADGFSPQLSSMGTRLPESLPVKPDYDLEWVEKAGAWWADRWMPVRLRVRNSGGVPFIAQRIPDSDRTGTMEFVARWQRQTGAVVLEKRLALPYDILPGDDYEIRLAVPTPVENGLLELTLALISSGAPEISAGQVGLRGSFHIVSAPSEEEG